MSATDHVITRQDRSDLETIESQIAKGMRDVADGLIKIRDRKLYLIHYDTFEEYCELRLKRSRSWAYDQMQLEDTRKSLPPEMSKILDTDSSVRELQKVPKKRRMGVIRSILGAEKNVTPQTIKEAAKPPSKQSHSPHTNGAPKRQEIIDVKEVVRDATGYEIPEHLVEFYQQAQANGKDLITRVSSLRGAVRRGQDESDKKFAFVNISTTISLLNNLYGELSMLTPYVVCPYCQGQVKDKCVPCKKTGFLPKHIWEHAVPADLKAVREKGLKKK